MYVSINYKEINNYLLLFLSKTQQGLKREETHRMNREDCQIKKSNLIWSEHLQQQKFDCQIWYINFNFYGYFYFTSQNILK